MSQITLYLDQETEVRVRKTAKQYGLSVSKWAARTLREKVSRTWPKSAKELSGAWKDFPTGDEIRRGLARDSRREGF
jgi:hypothetical protein